MDLYNKLLKCGIFRANPKAKTNFEKKKTLLDAETSSHFENGVALGKYLLVLRDALKRNNQSLNIDQSKIQTLKAQSTPQARLFNWNILCSELDKIGIEIDTDARSLIVAGDQEQILTAFTRLERFLVKIAGKQILNLDGLKSEASFGAPNMDNLGNLAEKSNARRGAKPNQKKVKDGVDILTMNAEREPVDTESTLELILNTLCRAFQMKPKQAAALLTNNNQFLIHSIVKGVKGKYEPLIAWYQDVYANSKHLTILLELELEQFPNSTNFQKVLATLSCGLYSHSLDICKWCSKLLTKIGYDFGQNQQMFNQAMSWFLEKEGGLELSLHALKKHPDLAEDFVAFITQFSSVNDQVEQIYKNELKKYFSSPLEYVNAINDLFPFMVAQSSQDIRRSGILDFWIESCIRQADNDGKHSYDERIAALTLLTEIWIAYTDLIDLKEEVANQVLSMLKRGSRDKHRPIRTVSVSSLFRLLDKFSEEKNSSAPSIYKTLIFSLVENPNDSILRELYFINFMSLFEANQTIPVGLLVEPLIKQIQVTEGVTYFYKIFDFDFFSYIAKHPKLNLQGALPIADLMAKIYLNEVTYSSAAAVPFVQICSRFINDEQMQEFIVKFETICFSMLMGLEKNAEELQQKHQQMLQAKDQAKSGQKKILALPAPPNQVHAPKRSPNKKLSKEEKMKQLREQDEDVTRRLKKSHIVEVTMKIQNLRNEDVNEQLREMLLSANKRFLELYGFFNKGIMALLKWWGDPDSIMHSYVRAVEEREAREKAERERREREEKERARRELEHREKLEREERERRQKEAQEKIKYLRSSADYESLNDEDRRLMLGYDSADQQFREGSANGSKQQSVRNSLAVLPYTGTGAIRNLKNQKALQQIEKIKRNKQEKEEQKRLEEERKKITQERKNKKLKEQLDKRKLELGVGNVPSEPQALIYKDGAVLSENDRLKKLSDQKMMIPQIDLIDLDQEEERDKEAVNMYMKKYQKLWRNLYYKYCNSGFSSKQISNFDQYNEKSQTINVAEMTKLLKDHDTFPKLISKAELQQLFRQINTKLFNRNDLQALDYNGYLQFMQQMAYFIYQRPPKDISHLPPVESIKALVQQFEQATRARGNSTLLFEDPDATGMGDQQLIKALNEKLQYDPNYPVPEGYFKQVEKTPIYEYRIPDSVVDQIPESSVVAAEVFDGLIFELFGIHILEPLVTFEERLKVRPTVKNTVKPQAEALNYMKKVEKKTRAQDTLNPYTSLSTLEKQKLNSEIKPTLNVALKLEVAQYPLKERPYVQEVAEVFEEILQAAEKGLEYLPPRANRAPGQIFNEAKQKKQQDMTTEQETTQMKEELRKKRDQQVKSELQKIKEQKERDLEENKRQREERERQEKEDKKRQQEDIRRKLDNKKKHIEDSKNLKLEEVMRKRQEEEEKNKELEEKKKRERAEFMKKQKQKLEDEFSQAKREREELAAKQAELSQKEKEYQARIRSNMENFINESKQDRHKEQQERQQINEFLKQQEVENIFALYERPLRHMYKFYASQDKKDVEFNLETSMNTCNFREFIRFTYQQNIVPALIPPEDAVQIYRQLVRERLDEIKSQMGTQTYLNDKMMAQVLDYEFFKKSIVRIAIMAQDELGGQREDLLLQKLDHETKKKQDDQKKRDKLRKLQDEKQKLQNQVREEMKEEYKQQMQKTAKSPAKVGKGGPLKEEIQYEINQSIKEKEEAFFEKWMKQREAQGISLKKRIIGKEKEGTKKIITKKKITGHAGANGEDEDMDNIREGDDFEDGAGHTRSKGGLVQSMVGGSAVVRKTKALKALKELEEQEHIKDSLAQTKIENKQIRKDLNVMVVTAKTIEAMMKYLGIEPEDTRYGLDNKLNQHRIEIQGQKPNKVKKSLKPNKLEVIRGSNLNQSIEEERQEEAQEENQNLESQPNQNDEDI